ncbi:MAG: hypothetical protein U0790_17580 [Isosphaeraceae bacterium]
MFTTLRLVTFAGLFLTGLVGPDRAGFAGAQQPKTPEHSARGGILATAEGLRFEVLFFPTGARVFPLDNSQGPVDTSRLAGTATFYHPNAPERPWFSRPLHPEPVVAGQTATSLDLIIGLTDAPRTGAAVVFEISGLPGRAHSTVMFKVPLEFVASSTPATTAPEGSVSAQPRYIYGPGAYGYGYYAVPGPETQPQPAVSTPTYAGTPTYSSPADPMSGHTVGWMHRDWATGRSSPLARPWMRPRD